MNKSQRIINYALVALSIMVVATEALFAAPAKPGVKTAVQADGTKLNIIVGGDEFFKYRTTESGYPISLQEDGFYYYAQYDTSGVMSPTEQRVSVGGRLQAPPSTVTKQSVVIAAEAVSSMQSASRSAVATRSSDSGFPSEGTIRSAVILVEYSDVKFSISDTQQAFWNQLNQEGYAVEGATGSAKDYFTANSRGLFDGEFDVYGPYTLSNVRSYYGGNDTSTGADLRPDQMVWDAVSLADADGVDFSQYDYDEDGYIDNVFVYYAGHNEAEWGPEESVWPHKWVVASRPVFDGKILYVYACTSELRGDTGTTIAGIGTFCHEFSHVFGLADHYDTTGTTNGSSYGTGYYDIMGYGSYNNSGNTPPMHNGLELDMIGWLSPTIVDKSQEIEIEPINTGEVYKFLTDVDGEYFLVENHNKSSIVWENYIAGSGLFIYHVDQSSPYLTKWYYNAPNGDTSHECFKMIMAGGASSLSMYNEYSAPYPYGGNTEWSSSSSPAAKSWSGKDLSYNIANIEQLENGNIKFLVVGTNITISCSDDNIYVDQSITLTSTIDDDSLYDSISWSCSDESICTTSADGNTLEVVFNQAGSATFTVTYSNANGDSASAVTTISATVFQGARGVITDAQDPETVISGAVINFYAVTRTSASSYTRSSNSATQAVTNQDGEYSVELSTGYYEMEVIATNYESLFELIQIEQGYNEVNFSMSSYSQTIEEISIAPYQRSVTIKWNPKEYTSFAVEIFSGQESLVSAAQDQNFSCSIMGLTPNTTYSIVVSAKESSGQYVELYTAEFTTLEQLTTIPLIYLEGYNFTAGEVLELHVLNTEDDDVVDWYFDGSILQATKVTLSEGEHTIQVQVVRSNGKTYRANKKINVK